MTITAIDAQVRAPEARSDGDRLRLTAGRLVGRAHTIIRRYGHARGDEGFGSPAVGFTLVGAIYAGAGFYESRFNLRDPHRCGAHRGRPGTQGPCEIDCENPLWQQCNLAFTYLAETFQTGNDELPDLTRVEAAPRDFRVAVEVSDVLDESSARRLLARVLHALNPDLPQARRAALPAPRTQRPNAKLTPQKVLEIRRRADGGEGVSQLAWAFGVSEPTVLSVVRGASWRAVGGPVDAAGRVGRLDSETVLRMRQRRAEDGVSTHGLAREFAVSTRTAHAVVTGRAWPEVGGPLHTPRSQVAPSAPAEVA